MSVGQSVTNGFFMVKEGKMSIFGGISGKINLKAVLLRSKAAVFSDGHLFIEDFRRGFPEKSSQNVVKILDRFYISCFPAFQGDFQRVKN